MDNVKKFAGAVVAGAIAAPIGWYFPAFAFALVGAFVAAAGVGFAGMRRHQVSASAVPPVVVRPVVAVESVDGMLMVPVRPETHHHSHAA